MSDLSQGLNPEASSERVAESALEDKVRAFSRRVHGDGWLCREQRAELEDHLHCEVERLRREQGLSAEEALEEAIRSLGDIEAMIAEHTKNHGPFLQAAKRILAPLDTFSRKLGPKRAAALNIGVSLFFAGLILVADWWLEGAGYAHHSDTARNLLIAVWFVPYSFLSFAGVTSRKKKRCSLGR